MRYNEDDRVIEKILWRGNSDNCTEEDYVRFNRAREQWCLNDNIRAEVVDQKGKRYINVRSYMFNSTFKPYGMVFLTIYTTKKIELKLRKLWNEVEKIRKMA